MPQQIYQSVRQPGGDWKAARGACQKMLAPDGKTCLTEVQARSQEDVANAQKMLNVPNLPSVKEVGEPIRMGRNSQQARLG